MMTKWLWHKCLTIIRNWRDLHMLIQFDIEFGIYKIYGLQEVCVLIIDTMIPLTLTFHCLLFPIISSVFEAQVWHIHTHILLFVLGSLTQQFHLRIIESYFGHDKKNLYCDLLFDNENLCQWSPEWLILPLSVRVFQYLDRSWSYCRSRSWLFCRLSIICSTIIVAVAHYPLSIVGRWDIDLAAYMTMTHEAQVPSLKPGTSKGACHPGGHCWHYYPGTLSCGQDFEINGYIPMA